MVIEVKVPGFPESVTDGTLTTWHRHPGDRVKRDEVLADIETDKVVFEIRALQDGILKDVTEDAGATVVSEQVIAHIELGVAANTEFAQQTSSDESKQANPAPVISPSARKLIIEHGLQENQITGTGKDGRILKEDVLRLLEPTPHVSQVSHVGQSQVVTPLHKDVDLTGRKDGRVEKRAPMSRLRARIAERLVEAQQSSATLTTFNEVNMQAVMELRKRYRESFEKTHGVRLGFMSFFVKAVVEALMKFPEVNASIDASDVVYHGYFDIGIAVGTPRGLVVPILRDADSLRMAEIEQQIKDYGAKAQEGKLAIEDITGGTFSITNGGVFGSLLSTPILNPPQSAILGMHKIQEKPVVEDGEIVIRPMMYLALSYDHRIIDGREAVQFLVSIKESIEDPARMLLDL